MPRFEYTARDRSGQSVSAGLEASSRKDALRLLAARGLVAGPPGANPARPESGTGDRTESPSSNPPRNPVPEFANPAAVTRKQRLPFLQALSDLTGSGLSAGEAVRLLSQRIQEPALRALCQGLWERLSEGQPLSRAMEEFPQVFDTRRSTSSRPARPPAASTTCCSA